MNTEDAYDIGYGDFYDGKEIEDCPFEVLKLIKAWKEGWKAAEKESEG